MHNTLYSRARWWYLLPVFALTLVVLIGSNSAFASRPGETAHQSNANRGHTVAYGPAYDFAMSRLNSAPSNPDPKGSNPVPPVPPGPLPPQAVDAYIILVPVNGAPPNGGTANVGDRFVLELWVNTGSNTDATAQQSYITFTYGLLQNARVSSIATSCVPTNSVTADITTFDAPLQNEVCD